MVEPCKSTKKIKALYALLKGSDKTHRNATLFRLGISTALRISDLLKLKYDDVFHEDYRFREYVRTTEKKTKKFRQIKLPEKVKEVVKSYAKKNKLKEGDWLFPSHHDKTRHIDRTVAWKILKKNAELVGIPNFGTHSLRKTFGYHYYQQTKDIGLLMRVFNHSSQAVTLRYIGIEQEGVDKVYTEVEDILAFQ